MAQGRVLRGLPARVPGRPVRNRWGCAMEDIEVETGCMQVRPGGPHGQGLDRAREPIARLCAVWRDSCESADHRDLTAPARTRRRSEEHTSELQSLMRISYAVFCLKKKK